MCLLINQPTTAPALPTHWLDDFFSYNSDGVGVMYSENDCLVIEKILPKTSADFVAFYNTHIAGKNCAFHLRMRTHGDTDLTNCHPYEVLNRADHGIDLALMHNGILSTGNKADTSKSDTWHYIRDYLRPLLAKNPDFAFHPAFSALIGDHIGASNKFVLMDNAGRVATVNESSGVFWGGLWLSNTYAWTATNDTSKTAPIGKKAHKLAKRALHQVNQQPTRQTYASQYGYARASSSYANWDDYDWDDNWKTGKTPASSMTSNQTYATNYSATRWDADDSVSEYLGILAECGSEGAAGVAFTACLDFVDLYGLDAFVEVAEMTIEADISEDWFVKLITNPAQARETFAWLKPLKQTQGA